MARELRWWLAATLVACGVIALGYVPPRGVTPEPKSRNRRPEATTARLRAQGIADQWRAAELALRLAQYRQQLEPELVRRRDSDQPGAALLIDAPDTIPESARQQVRAALDTVWRQLGLGLTKRTYDLARFPDWDRERPEPPAYSWLVRNRDSKRWEWRSVYAYPIAAIACLGGRAASCRTAVLAGSGDPFDDSLPRLFKADLRWWREQRLPYSSRYLADVAREVSHDRFLRFWNSTEPVDTALAAALRMPVGDWTERWQRRFVPRLPLGPAAPLAAAVLGILLAGAAIIGAALSAARRQVG